MTSSAGFQEALIRYEIELPEECVERLQQFCQLLWDLNRQLNLTRHTDIDTFISRDLTDSLQLSQLLSPNEVTLDIGSGGGVPGVVLALIRPDLRISLSESVGKKATALETIVRELNLSTPVHRCRAEHVLRDSRYDVLVARAVGPLWKMLKWFEPHWGSIGRLLAVKGPRWVEERGEARHRGYLRPLQLRRVVSYPMPGTEAESVILKIWPKAKPEP